MSPRTRELVAPWFDIPRVQGLYVRIRAITMSTRVDVAAEARAELGIPPEVTAFLLIGRVQPYKGITELLDAFDLLGERDLAAMSCSWPARRAATTRRRRSASGFSPIRPPTRRCARSPTTSCRSISGRRTWRSSLPAVAELRRSRAGSDVRAAGGGAGRLGGDAQLSPSYAVQYDGDRVAGLADALVSPPGWSRRGPGGLPPMRPHSSRRRGCPGRSRPRSAGLDRPRPGRRRPPAHAPAIATVEVARVTVVHVTGARPNFPKAAPVIAALAARASRSCWCTPASTTTTGCPRCSSASSTCRAPTSTWASARAATPQTAAVMIALEELFSAEPPALVVVYGDVNSTLAAALVAAKLRTRSPTSRPGCAAST